MVTDMSLTLLSLPEVKKSSSKMPLSSAVIGATTIVQQTAKKLSSSSSLTLGLGSPPPSLGMGNGLKTTKKSTMGSIGGGPGWTSQRGGFGGQIGTGAKQQQLMPSLVVHPMKRGRNSPLCSSASATASSSILAGIGRHQEIPMIFVLLLMMAVLMSERAEGYNIDRLLEGRNGGLSESQQQAMFRQYQSADELWRPTNKKSPEFNAAKLTKFAGNGARNCFFTPIQCMLQHDVNKLRRMVDPADIGAKIS